jgi:hypothetical protein
LDGADRRTRVRKDKVRHLDETGMPEKLEWKSRCRVCGDAASGVLR